MEDKLKRDYACKPDIHRHGISGEKCYFCAQDLCIACTTYDDSEDNFFHDHHYPCEAQKKGQGLSSRLKMTEKFRGQFDEPNLVRTILQEATELVDGDRQKAYGPPSESFEHIAQVWSIILRPKMNRTFGVSPQDVALMMVGLKLCRQAFKPSRDNLVDMAAYAHIYKLLEDS